MSIIHLINLRNYPFIMKLQLRECDNFEQYSWHSVAPITHQRDSWGQFVSLLPKTNLEDKKNTFSFARRGMRKHTCYYHIYGIEKIIGLDNLPPNIYIYIQIHNKDLQISPRFDQIDTLLICLDGESRRSFLLLSQVN